MRTNYHRQSRREAMCIKAPKAGEAVLGVPGKKFALTASDAALAEVAERIAEELELSPELIDLLSLGHHLPTGIAPLTEIFPAVALVPVVPPALLVSIRRTSLRVMLTVSHVSMGGHFY